ncbi:MAG: hypothetical protein HC830_09470 [Bacteroidetes bacterium]|nr:hypothetical protein [Bacteroidota bacterium]
MINPFGVNINGSLRKIGLILCEDMWSDDYTINPIDILLKKEAEVIINISCSPWTWRKNNKRHSVVRDRIKAKPVYFIYANNIGIQNNGKNIFVCLCRFSFIIQTNIKRCSVEFTTMTFKIGIKNTVYFS